MTRIHSIAFLFAVGAVLAVLILLLRFAVLQPAPLQTPSVSSGKAAGNTVLLSADSISDTPRKHQSSSPSIRRKASPSRGAMTEKPSRPTLQMALEERNAAMVLRMAFALMNEEPLKSQLDKILESAKPSLSLKEQQTLLNLLESKEIQELMEFIAIAAEKEFCDFELDYSKGFSLELSHLSPIRKIALLTSVLAINASDSDNIESAYGFLRLGLGVSNRLADEKLLISQLVQEGSDGALVSSIDRILQSNSFSEEQASAVLADLSLRNYSEGMIQALRQESEMALVEIDKLPSGEFSFLGNEIPKEFKDKAFVEINKAKYKELMDECVRLASLPYDASVEESMNALQKQCEGLSDQYAIVRSTFPALFQSSKVVEKNNATLESIRIKLATAIYRNRTGREPDSLDDLKEILRPNE